MIAGVRGRLITSTYARTLVTSASNLSTGVPLPAMRALAALAERIDANLGPASSVRAITDVAILPLLRILGFTITARRDDDLCWLQTATSGEAGPLVCVSHWDRPLDGG